MRPDTRPVHVLCLVLLVLCLVGCSKFKLKPVDTPVLNVGVYRELSGAQVEQAILKACANRGWKIDRREPGLIEASLAIRTHRVTVSIPYSGQELRIEHKDSTNLLYTASDSQPRIHRAYNRWVKNLEQDIMVNLQAMQAAAAALPAQQAASPAAQAK